MLFQSILRRRVSPRTTRRSLMDAHTRPSHSRMIDRPGNLRLQPPPIPPSNARFYRILGARAAMAGGMVYCWTEYVMDLTLCEGPSMTPTIQSSGELVLMDKWHVRQPTEWRGTERARLARQRQEESHDKHVWHEPRLPPVNEQPPLSWRQVWQQIRSPLSIGDVVVVHHPRHQGTVCKRVLGMPGDQVVGDRGLLLVEDGHVWLEGDNPANSSDSRSYGAVPAACIVGRVVCRVWPLRGRAFLERGLRPQPKQDGRQYPSSVSLGATILPAGYEGQEILRSVEKRP